jgi:integrase/recombinase XerD
MRTLAGRSAFSEVITRYLALKTALGRRYTLERRVLEILTAFLRQAPGGPEDLTPETFARWAQSLQHLTPTVRRNRLRIVRNLCLYRRRTDPACFVPDRALFPAPHQPRAPYIFTTRDIAQLVRATATLSSPPQCPLRAQVFRLAVILLYTTGLRRGELLRLTVADYTRDEQLLQIRETKFHKSRLVPLSPATAHEVDRYLQARHHRQLSLAPPTPLLAHGVTTLRGYTGVGLGTGFRQLLTTAGIRTPEGHWPRVHDLRHTFAVHALARWYRTGADVQAKLPLLATYMGHVSIVSTAYYLPFVEPLRTLATTRFAQHCRSLLEVAATTGRGRRP